MTACTTIDSPIGELLLTGEGGALTRLYMSPFDVDPAWERDPAALRRARPAARRVLRRRAARSSSCRSRPAGTAFQQRVWALLLRDPLRRDDDLRRARGRARATRAPSRAVGLGQRPQPDLDRRPVPPRDRRRRLARRLRRRARAQARAARPTRRRSLQASVQRSGSAGSAAAASKGARVRKLAGIAFFPTAASRSSSSIAYAIGSTEFDLPIGPPIFAVVSVALACAAVTRLARRSCTNLARRAPPAAARLRRRVRRHGVLRRDHAAAAALRRGAGDHEVGGRDPVGRLSGRHASSGRSRAAGSPRTRACAPTTVAGLSIMAASSVAFAFGESVLVLDVRALRAGHRRRDDVGGRARLADRRGAERAARRADRLRHGRGDRRRPVRARARRRRRRGRPGAGVLRRRRGRARADRLDPAARPPGGRRRRRGSPRCWRRSATAASCSGCG